MRRASVLLAVAALVAAPAAVFAAEPFEAELTGAAEVPPVTTDASGSATATISDDESSIEFEVTFEGLSGPATMSHIHWGAADVAGPPIFWLTDMAVMDNPSPLSGTLTEADFVAVDGGPQSFAEALAAMRAGNTYVNVHTAANQAGEIRGQLQLIPDTSLAQPGGSSTGAPLGLLLLAIAGAAFLITYRRLAARAV